MAIIGIAVGEASSGSYRTLLAARILQGFSTSAFESLIIAAVGDMFFVHQRGYRVAFITFILNAASSLASIICGQVTSGLGWVWLFHLLQIFTCVQFILMFLFCPETTYIRDHSYDIDQVQDEKLEQLAETEHKRQGIATGIEGSTEGSNLEATSSAAAPPPKKTFVQELAVYTGKYEDANIIKLLVGPFITLLNLGTLWEAATSGVLTMWYVTSGISQAEIFAAPPWNFDAAEIGYLSAGPFIGGLVGSAVIAFTSDPMAKFFTKRNKGIYEPEFRLYHMIFATAATGIGMFGYGHFTDIGASAYVCALFQGIMMAGVLVGTIAPVSYALDAYRDASNEIFIMNMLLKNFLFFGISYVANNWVARDGPFEAFAVCGATSMFLVFPLLPQG